MLHMARANSVCCLHGSLPLSSLSIDSTEHHLIAHTPVEPGSGGCIDLASYASHSKHRVLKTLHMPLLEIDLLLTTTSIVIAAHDAKTGLAKG